MESEQIRKPDSEPSPFNYDLCDVWIDVGDHRCQNYWREEIVLTEDTHVKYRGASMWGTYPAGTWRFCRMHARIFNRDKENHGKA